MVDMVNRITPRHKAITLKAMGPLRTTTTATTALVHARPAKGNPESIIPQDYPRRREDAHHVSHPSISHVSRLRSAPLHPVPLV